MSKRVATYQISDRNPVDPRSDEEEDEGRKSEYSNSFDGRANEEELKRRK